MEPKKHIKISKDVIDLEYGYFTLYIDNNLFDISLDYKTYINLANKTVTQTEDKIIIEYQSGEVFGCPPATDNFGDAVEIMRHLFSGKKPWKDSDHFLLKVYKMYKTLTGMDFIHFEILCSQLLRDSGNPTYPARLNTKNYDPMIMGIKNIPSTESFLSSISFENFNKSITTGLTYNTDTNSSVLEKLVTGDL